MMTLRILESTKLKVSSNGINQSTKTNIATILGLETENRTVVFQRRGDFGEPRENFWRSWADYKSGFGDKEKEFWIGTEQLYQLTKSGDKKLRVELVDELKSAWAEYDNFKIERVQGFPGYRPRSSGFTGNASVSYGCNGLRYGYGATRCMNHCPTYRNVFRHLGTMNDLYYLFGYDQFESYSLKNSTMWLKNK